MNTWPKGHRHAISQDEHDRWNAKHYPGTRQICVQCDEPTGRCEDDSIYAEDGTGPLCEECRAQGGWGGDRVSEHVVALTTGPTDILHLHCDHCGADLRLKLPVSIDEMCAANDAFVARHRGCRKPETEVKP